MTVAAASVTSTGSLLPPGPSTVIMRVAMWCLSVIVESALATGTAARDDCKMIAAQVLLDGVILFAVLGRAGGEVEVARYPNYNSRLPARTSSMVSSSFRMRGTRTKPPSRMTFLAGPADGDPLPVPGRDDALARDGRS